MESGLGSLAGAGALFLATHLIPTVPGLRDALVRVLGERGYLSAFVLVSLGCLGLFAYAFAGADHVELWGSPLWARHVPLIVMPFALILLVAGYTTKNPGAVMQEGAIKAADPAPGILKVTRHPLMWGVALFSGAHIAANGDAAALIFFGVIGALALVGMPLMDARKRARLGRDWERFAAATSAVPFAAMLEGRAKPSLKEIGWWRMVPALALYAGLLFAHGPVLGFPALPA